MKETDEGLKSQVMAFSARFLGRELDEQEHERLAALVAEWSRLPGEAATHIDATLRESRQAMDGTLAKADELARSQLALATAGADSEAHALARLLDKADSLGDLRPSRLSSAKGAAQGHLVMAQIADRLANLVKQEVEARFQERFGPLAQQVERALAGLEAARERDASTGPPTEAGSPAAAPAAGRRTGGGTASRRRN